MCQKRNTRELDVGFALSKTAPKVDNCMKELIDNLNWIMNDNDWKTVACCCGHGKYPMTIVVESPDGLFLELNSDAYIKRKKRFYIKDKQGYYYIPESLESRR